MTSSFWDTFKILIRLGWDSLGMVTGIKEGGFFKSIKNNGFGKALLGKLSDEGTDTIVESIISTDETSQIISRVGDGLGTFAGSVLNGIYGQLTDDEEQGLPEFSLTRSFSQAHYPEHYLAWLETGGEKEIESDEAFALMDEREREMIHWYVNRWIE